MNEDYSRIQLEARRELEKQLPLEFDRFFSYLAYDKGHAYGEDEINAIYCDMVNEFIPVLESYLKNRGLTK